MSEFVTLEDGRRVLLHDGGRGLMTSGVRSTGGWQAPDVSWKLTLEQLTDDVLLVVLPDDDDDPEPHPWSWLSDLARSRGLDVTADDLRELPTTSSSPTSYGDGSRPTQEKSRGHSGESLLGR